MKKVTLYTSNTCEHCHNVKAYLDEKGIPYTDNEVNDSEINQQRALELSGDSFVPVIHIQNGEDKVLVGFDEAKLEAALAE